MTSPTIRKLLLAGCALALAGCGGGGGGVTSLPRPQPTPTPTPGPVTVPAAIIPSVTQSTNFAAMGLEAAYTSPDLTSDGFAVAFDSSTGLYVMDFPSTEPGGFYPGPNPPGDIWTGNVVSDGANRYVEVLNPANPDFPLTYTGLAGYRAGESYGWAAFGVETAPGAVPASGTASYDAKIRGWTVDASERISGDAALSFDFAAGTLSGHISPILFSDYDWNNYELGRYDFVNTIFGAGSTTFSGEFSHPIFGQNGSFNGMFTGPAAQELMASWTASYRHPLSNSDSTMIGVLVGRR